MKLRILGSNGTYPTPGRPTSGYLLSHEDTTVWVDAGSGTLAALADVMEPAAVDALVVTHIHVDHCVDLLPFSYYLRFRPGPRPVVRLLAPEGVAERLGAISSLDGDFGGAFVARQIDEGDTETVGPIELRFGRADHPVPTRLVRAEAGGRTLAYSSDTGPDCELEDFAREVDLLLCEASEQGEVKTSPQHLTAAEAGGIARRAGVKALMLTHLRPHLEPQRSVAEAERAFGRPVRLAVPGMEVVV